MIERTDEQRQGGGSETATVDPAEDGELRANSFGCGTNGNGREAIIRTQSVWSCTPPTRRSLAWERL